MKLGWILGIVFATQFVCSGAEPATNSATKKWSIFDIFKPRATATNTNTTTAQPTVSGSDVISHGASVSSGEISAGLKEAIGNGLTLAVAALGRTNGFLTNLTVRIPVPERLSKIEKTLRALGQDELVDEFVASMNHAAEQAVPVATDVFFNSLKQLTIADAAELLQSPSKMAATDYFRRTTTNELAAKFLPIVQAATERSGVTAAYKNLLKKASFASVFINESNLDLDQYVTAKSLDGLFTMVGEEEKRIRENPQARITTLLQKVFGALQKTGS